jgi:hypothetical protein
MASEKQERKGSKVLSRTGLVLGAAGLLMFIVGLKRSYHLDEEHTVSDPEARRKKRPAE